MNSTYITHDQKGDEGFDIRVLVKEGEQWEECSAFLEVTKSKLKYFPNQSEEVADISKYTVQAVINLKPSLPIKIGIANRSIKNRVAISTVKSKSQHLLKGIRWLPPELEVQKVGLVEVHRYGEKIHVYPMCVDYISPPIGSDTVTILGALYDYNLGPPYMIIDTELILNVSNGTSL